MVAPAEGLCRVPGKPVDGSFLYFTLKGMHLPAPAEGLCRVPGALGGCGVFRVFLVILGQYWAACAEACAGNPWVWLLCTALAPLPAIGCATGREPHGDFTHHCCNVTEQPTALPPPKPGAGPRADDHQLHHRAPPQLRQAHLHHRRGAPCCWALGLGCRPPAANLCRWCGSGAGDWW